MSIYVYFYDSKREILGKPANYKDFINAISTIFELDKDSNLVYEYKCKNGKYYELNESTYNNFKKDGNVIEVYSCATLEELNCKKEEYIQEENINLIAEKSKENSDNLKIESEISKSKKIDDKKNEVDFYKPDEFISDKSKVNESMSKSKILISKQKVKESIIKQKIEEIRKSKIERIKKERAEKSLKAKDKEKEKEINNKDDIGSKIKEIIDDKFNLLKEDIANESTIEFNKILSESQIKREKINIENISINNNKINIVSHVNVSCNGCGKCPIIGNRYKCVYCPDFDYCEECEKTKGDIHNHPFYKLKFRI